MLFLCKNIFIDPKDTWKHFLNTLTNAKLIKIKLWSLKHKIYKLKQIRFPQMAIKKLKK